MAEDVTQTLVVDTGILYVADAETAAPINTTVAPAAAWVEVGLLAKQGIAFAGDPQIAELFSFGRKNPTKTRKTREVKKFTARMQQWNTDTFTLGFNGGTVVVASGVATYEPPADEDLNDKALLFHFEDGVNEYRLHLARVSVRSGIQMEFSDEDYTTLPLDVTLLEPNAGRPWKLITNNAAFTATA